MKSSVMNWLSMVLCATVVAFVISCTPKTADKVVTEKKEEVTEVVGTAASDAAGILKGDVPTDPDVRMGTLSNGLKYYIKKNGKPENRAELRLAVNAGAMQEDDDQQGLAHFVEHMAFNGSDNFEKSELVDFLESVGTKFGPDLNAYTSFDETVYMLQVRTDEEDLLNKGMLILEDWAGGVTFDHEEIDKERGVVKSEWRTRLGAGERMSNQYYPVLYHESRYAKRLPIGKTEVIEGATYETVKRFYRDWYRPDLMAVVIVGDVDVDAMEKEIKERFSDLKNPDNPRKKELYPVPYHDETLVSIATDKEATMSNVRLYYKHDKKKINNLNDYRSTIVRSLYNRMLNSRLNEYSQKAEPPFTYAFSGYYGMVRSVDSYMNLAGVSDGGIMKGLEVLLLENARVLKHGFTASELKREKEAMLKSMERSYKERDKTESRRLASRYVNSFLNNNPIPGPKQTLDMYNEMVPTVTLAEVNSLAKNWIRDENRVVVATGPEKEGAEMPTEAQIRQLLAKMKSMDVDPYEDKTTDEPLLNMRLAPAGITAEKVHEKVGVTELTLANGVKVFLKPTDFKNDEILMTATSDGGHGLAGDADFISWAQAASVVSEGGVGTFDRIMLDKKLSGKKVSVRPFIGSMSEGMSGNCSPDDQEDMFKLIYLYFKHPRFDETALKSYVSKEKAWLGNLKSDPNMYFNMEKYKFMNGDHPRYFYFPSNEQYDAINMKQVMAAYRDRFGDAGDFRFFFVGNFEMEAMKGLVQTYLGNLPSKGRKEDYKYHKPNRPEGKVKKVWKKGEAPKTLVELQFDGEFDWDNHEARYQFSSMISALRIKLREKMREDEGGVYGVRLSGYVSKEPEERYNIILSFNADPKDADKLTEAAIGEIKDMVANGATEKDLTKVKETQKQERIKQLKENRFWLYRLRGLEDDGLPFEGLLMENYEPQIDKLTSEETKKIAQQVFDFNRMKHFVLEPE